MLLVGYTFIQLSGRDHGYWILLTSLFVCQPNYSATRRRLALRVVGTLAGVALGMPILYFIPSLEGQMIMIVICGMLFFTFRSVQYAQATMFITLLALLLFNLMGQGFEVAIPRIIDTLLGCLIAWFAVSFVWPDWRFRQLPAVVSKTFMPTVVILTLFWCSIIRVKTMASNTGLPGVMRIIAMLNWPRSCRI